MNRMPLLTVLIIAGLLLTFTPAISQEVSSQDIPSELVIADFNNGNKPNNVGGEFGSWNYAPKDETQGCWDWFEPGSYDGEEGYSLLMEYDVQSSNPAFCGLWMKLKRADISPYDVLTFWLKGDEKTGFTTRFKIEIRKRL